MILRPVSVFIFLTLLGLKNTGRQRTEHPEFMCSNEARWKVWDDMRGKFRIPIFAGKPLKRGPNGTDTDDFTTKVIEMSEPIKHYIAGKRDVKVC